MPVQLFDSSLEDLLPVRREPATFKRGEFIYRSEAPGVYYIHAGTVRTFHVADADARIVHHDFYRAGQLFGEDSLFPAPQPESAVAHNRAAAVSFWTAREFQELAERKPELLAALLKLQAERYRRMLERIERSETTRKQERILRALYDIAERIGEPGENGCLISGLTHELIASAVGTTREIVTMHLGALQRAGYVRFGRLRIELPHYQRQSQEAA